MTRKVKLAAALHRTVESGIPSTDIGRGGAQAVARVRVGADRSEATATTGPWRGFGLPAVGRALSSAVYGAGYYTSYGIVFSVMTVWHLLPLDNALGRGVSQGGTDAWVTSRSQADGRRAAPAARKHKVERSRDALTV